MKSRIQSLVAFSLFGAMAACSTEPTAPALSARQDVVQVSSTTGVVVYNNIPSPLPGNVVSQGYQCCATAELGDNISFGGTARRAKSATVLMSSWSLRSTYPGADAAGYSHPITLNIYAGSHPGGVGTRGPLLATITKTFLIPWRPVADPTCPGGTAWRYDAVTCYNGFAFTIEFDLTSIGLTLPSEIVYGVAFNTNTWGYSPIGQPGPYESLNVGLVPAPPTVGVDVEPDAVFWNTKIAGWYSDGGTGGFGIFRRDTGWSGYVPAVSFSAYAFPTTSAECKNGGWQSLTRADLTPFTNQGDCVSYVQNGK